MAEPYRVLSIDGGGIRGLIPALVLADLEARAGRPVAELFDLIAGTSTGGILALALTVPGDDGAPRYRAEQLAGLYEDEGPRIFSRSLVKRVESAEGLLDEKYSSDGLVGALGRYFGGARLREALSDVLICAYEIERRKPFFFRSARARADQAYDYDLLEAAHATAAAPTYFEPVQVHAGDGANWALIDGGVYATNPALCALAEVRHEDHARDVLLVSLGTGVLTRPIPYADARAWGKLEWVRPLIDVVFQGASAVAEFQLDQFLGDRHHRLQVTLDHASDDLDDASPENLLRLRGEAERLVAASEAELQQLAEELAR